MLVILAYRGGTLSKAGHNHVIAAHDLTGTVYVPDDPTRTSFEARFSVAELRIDEPELRAREGADFPPAVPDSAKEGTRHNMLSEALLDGARYPEIVMRGAGFDPSTDTSATPAGGPSPGSARTATTQAAVDVIVRDQSHRITVPASYTLDGDRLRVSADVRVKQSELGLTPFSALMGALQVQDELRIRLALIAEAAHVTGQSSPSRSRNVAASGDRSNAIAEGERAAGTSRASGNRN